LGKKRGTELMAIPRVEKGGAASLFEAAARIKEVRKDKDLDVLRQRRVVQELFLKLQSKATP
jgi:hypothetical protein